MFAKINQPISRFARPPNSLPGAIIKIVENKTCNIRLSYRVCRSRNQRTAPRRFRLQNIYILSDASGSVKVH